jgi:hypothetical protein
MDITDQLQEIGLVFTDDRFIAILKEMPISLVAAVEGDGITGHETPHEMTQMNVSASEQKMKMVWKQGPCITMDSSRIQYVLKAGQEILIVLVVPEDPAPLNSPGHDVLEKAGGIESWLARHGSIWLSGWSGSFGWSGSSG